MLKSKLKVNLYQKIQTKEKGYKKFIGTEYVIPSEKQIIPLYSITLKRKECKNKSCR